MFNRKIIIIGIIAIIVIAAVALKISNNNSSGSQQRSNEVIVKTEKPVTQTLTEELQYNGNIAAIQRADIFSKVTGNLENLFVDIGAFVKEGQLLAVIDSTQLFQTFAQTSATYNNNKLVYDRNAQLYKQNLISRQDYENSEAALKISEAAYNNAATQLSYCKITAPFSGYITQRLLDRGALIQNNSILFTLMKMDYVKVYVYILEKDLPLISDKSNCIVTVDGLPGKEFKGSITRKSNALDLNTRTMLYEIDIPNSGYILKPGMFATVSFLLSEHKNAVTLPDYAVLKESGQNYVFTIHNGKAKRINVKTGLVKNHIVEILDGISDTTEIISTGQEFVRENMPVKVQNNTEM